MWSTANTRCRTVHATTITAMTAITRAMSFTMVGEPVRGASLGTTRGPERGFTRSRVWAGASSIAGALAALAALSRVPVLVLGAAAAFGPSRVWQIRQVPGG